MVRVLEFNQNESYERVLRVLRWPCG